MNYILRSLNLDLSFLKLDLGLDKKIEFLLKKYLSLALGQSVVSIFNKRYTFDSRYGIGFLQSVFVDNAFIRKYLDTCSIVIDVGANTGQFNFFCTTYLKAKKVISFEPIKETYGYLKRNTDYCYNYALGRSNQKITMGISKMSLGASIYFPDTGFEKITAKCVRLDDLLNLKLNKVDLLKIDVEGAECDVVQGAKEMIKKSKYILVEASIKRSSSGNIGKLVSSLANISDEIEILDFGRAYYNNGYLEAMDVLFINNAQV